MEQVKVKAEVREVGKKALNRKLRREGFIPAILYGKGETPIGLHVHGKEFTLLMKKGSGTNALIDLELGATVNGGKAIMVMLKDYQTNLITRKLTHLDFLRINLKEKVAVKVPVRIIGKSIGLEKGGLIEQTRRELEVRCLPTKIPDSIEVDITELDLGHSLHVHDLKLPEGVELPHGADFTIVSIVAPREEEVAAPVAATEVPATEQKAGEAAPAAGAADAKAEKGEKAEKKTGDKK